MIREFLAVFLFLFMVASVQAATVPLVAPVLLRGEDGATRTLQAYKGQKVVVNVFASWCTPCLAEIPDLNTLVRKHAGQWQLLGIADDLDSDEALAAFRQDLKIEFPLFRFADGSAAVMEIRGFPWFGLMDTDSTWLLQQYGPLDKQRRLLDWIRTTANENP